ncbi:adhesion G-protein coupled receptor G2-like isoform X1 [Sebastes fasciatus]|uniref:adhesion G-protein coupled receptor G2-like isoform X1 n=1 Tax=Sebastes fasciatus TaxID=394691 RepID=UPI003D9F5A60
MFCKGKCVGQKKNTQGGQGKREISETRCCMEHLDLILRHGNLSNAIEAIEILEQFLEETEVNETTPISVNRFVALMHEPKGPFTGLDIYASENEARLNLTYHNCKVRVRLPRELDAGSNNTIVFCMFTWPEESAKKLPARGELYESRLFGVSVRGKTVSGLQERVNISMNLAANETREPSCVFLNFTTKKYSSDGCQTLWERGQSNVTCSCDHLTYFGVLMVSSVVPQKHQVILSYISEVGCGLSLFALVITVVLFITNRKVRADVSMKVHINLAIALILLNLHFLPMKAVAAQSSTGLCFYMALGLHYSLLATFSWMAVEGFHLYLLLVRVFNIYVRRYLLKLSTVGWGIPAVIVSLVVIIDKDKDPYGHVSLDSSNPNSTKICYIRDTTVKMVTTVGVFGLVFLFNITMLGVTIRRVVGLRQTKEFGQSERNRAKRDICTLLGVTTLLGITWGLVFFSFGHLTIPGLYLFCILNTLQGFFIFLWFLMCLRKTRNSDVKISSVTQSTNS